MRSHVPAVLLTLLLALGAGPRAAAGTGCPDEVTGVLRIHNIVRARHRVPPLEWDDDLAANAQRHAETCKWRHSKLEDRPGSGENIMYHSPLRYPYWGLPDVCSYAAYLWYLEVTNYNFDRAGERKEEDVPIGHYTAMVWQDSARIGCGYTRCEGGLDGVSYRLPTDYVVCQYHLGGNNGWYVQNVKRSAVQMQTADDWCETAEGGRCASCFRRPPFGQRMDGHPIRLDPITGRCVSACAPDNPNGVNCQTCGARGQCLRCKAGWRPTADRRCLRRRSGQPAVSRPDPDTGADPDDGNDGEEEPTVLRWSPAADDQELPPQIVTRWRASDETAPEDDKAGDEP